MAGIRRRRFLSSAALALPGAIIVNPREGVRTNDLAPVMKVTRVEAFLLDFEGDLYQQRLELRFAQYLHADIKFATPEDLVRQLKRDVAETRRIVR